LLSSVFLTGEYLSQKERTITKFRRNLAKQILNNLDKCVSDLHSCDKITETDFEKWFALRKSPKLQTYQNIKTLVPIFHAICSDPTSNSKIAHLTTRFANVNMYANIPFLNTVIYRETQLIWCDWILRDDKLITPEIASLREFEVCEALEMRGFIGYEECDSVEKRKNLQKHVEFTRGLVETMDRMYSLRKDYDFSNEDQDNVKLVQDAEVSKMVGVGKYSREGNLVGKGKDKKYQVKVFQPNDLATIGMAVVLARALEIEKLTDRRRQ
ncbi:hypothetical protein HK096_004960, partial [Nowakowskiella sp. JEL0078]